MAVLVSNQRIPAVVPGFSTAGVVHMAQDDWLTTESEVMAQWLDRHGGDDGLLEPFAVAGVSAQHMTQIHRMFLAETEQQTTFG